MVIRAGIVGKHVDRSRLRTAVFYSSSTYAQVYLFFRIKSIIERNEDWCLLLCKRSLFTAKSMVSCFTCNALP